MKMIWKSSAACRNRQRSYNPIFRFFQAKVTSGFFSEVPIGALTPHSAQVTALNNFIIRHWRRGIIGLYYPLDGITNLKYKLLYFLTPNKKDFKEKGASF